MNEYMEEEWKDIRGYEGYYQISNLGRVKSLDRAVVYSDGRVRKFPGKIMALTDISNAGYIVVSLQKNNIREKFTIHKLVASHFCPNPDNKPIVNHLDENKLNNRSDNLCWATYTENLMWNDSRAKRPYNPTTKNKEALKRLWNKNKKPVVQYDLNHNLIAIYPSAHEATESLGLLPYTKRNIQQVCEGRQRTAYGHIWEYSN